MGAKQPRLGTMHPCERGQRCSCHSAGPSKVLLAFVVPALAAPLERRVTDAGQAPDDPDDFHQDIELADLVRERLAFKYVDEGDGWVFDSSWQLHGRRFGRANAEEPSGVLAIESTLPIGWGDDFKRTGMYAIPLVVSFAVVIALMIGSLIGALAFRRGRSRSRRRKKRLVDDSNSEKADSLVARSLSPAPPTPDLEQADAAKDHPSPSLARVRSWARRSAAWRVQARIGMRRRIAHGRKRSLDNGPDTHTIPEDTHEDQLPTRPATPQNLSPAPIYHPTPSPRPDSPDPRADSNDAHPDAAPSDEPAYDDPGAGAGLPPAYRRGDRDEIRRGKMPARSIDDDEQVVQSQAESAHVQQARQWSRLDTYAFAEHTAGASFTAHVATDDKHVLEQLRAMVGAPTDQHPVEPAAVPGEEDVFGSEAPEEPEQVAGTSGLPLPPAKTGAGPVARYGEADMSLPRYLEEGGTSASSVPCAPPLEELGLGTLAPLDCPSAPPLDGPSAPLDGPSAPPLDEDSLVPSAPPLPDSLVPPHQ